jgi:hypothetical protein
MVSALHTLPVEENNLLLNYQNMITNPKGTAPKIENPLALNQDIQSQQGKCKKMIQLKCHQVMLCILYGCMV